jgi:hypothetical protein
MNDTLCQVQTQYYENYGDAKNPNWKAKGSTTFKLMVDADDFAYAKECCIVAIKKCLKQASNDHCKFDYIDYDLIFTPPVELKGFEENLVEAIDIMYSNQ